MNYLAHAFLSKHDEQLLIGNFIADHVRGNHFEGLDSGIVEGIRMHREIDSFTDSHPKFREAKRVFYNGFERYSGVLVDVLFDHLLASAFDNFSNMPLQTFSENVYDVYTRYRSQLPEHSTRFLSYLLKNNLYSAYASEEGIQRVLFHLSQRIGGNLRLDHAMPLFVDHREQLELCFREVFGDLSRKF